MPRSLLVLGSSNCTNKRAKPTFVGWKSTKVDFAIW
jgi:hypothetical protein